MDAYWGKIKKDSQYQLKEVFDWAVHLEHLQAVLREFDSAATSNKNIMIRYFRKGLRPSVWAQLDARGRDLDSLQEAVEKAINVEAKALLQSSASTRNMDLMCPQEKRPAKKEEKDCSRKNKSTDSAYSDTSSGKQLSSTQQTSSANPKKDQDHQQGGFWQQRGQRKQGQSHNSPATGVNASTVKKEVKDISQVECYNCHRKGHYATNCL